MMVVGVLSMADRAPDLIHGLLATTRDQAHALEIRFGTDFVDRGDLPFEWDTMSHFMSWAAAGLLGHIMVRRRFSSVLLGLGLFAMSAAIEVAQPFLSSTRSLSLTDLTANGLGIILGISMAAIVTRIAVRPRHLLTP